MDETCTLGCGSGCYSLGCRRIQLGWLSEAAESSLQLGSIVLTSLDVSVDEIASVIQEYREDDYARLEEIVG